MTPRAEAMVLEQNGWRSTCGHHRSRFVSEKEGDPWRCELCGGMGERIEVVPAADYQRALDLLEVLVVAWDRWERFSDEDWENACSVLRAAGRLDG